MLKRTIIAVSIAALSFGATSAQADWQNTKWGMSEAEVLALPFVSPLAPADAAGKSMTAARLFAKFRSPYSSGDFQFNAIYMFDSQNKLAMVALELTSGDPNVLRGELMAKYGPPRQANRYVTSWDSGTDEVSYTNIVPPVMVQYSPRLTRNNSGL